MSNPFTLSFGKKPLQYISRIVQTNQVIEEFCAKQPSNQIFMLTGVRGSGKTVMMTNLAAELRKIPDWIVVELNPTRDLLQSLAAKIYSLPEMHTRFLSAKFDFSAFGLGVSVENAAPVTDIENALELMLAEINKAGKRLLVTIDEVTNSEYIRVFASAFQIFIREEYPIFLIMTGLYENIYDLQNDKALTFLYRAPKIMLEPLNYTAIRKNYMDIFKIEITQAEKMTELTKGYPFAFQVLGYLYWEYRADKKLEEILPEYDQYLDEYVYSKIWSELSMQDKEILTVISVTGETRVKNIRESLSMNSNLFSVYRERLKRKGVVDTREYGRMSLALPRFDEFVKIRQLE
ncbi:ATP-binding protein [Roseburia sp. MUC/MUC-530-WT-4D]|uniref:ATP-binding protein n=1 Tax=Roseburia porci TaxID=2605790 RepID=A0A6L5YPB8_9FIRM|nr:ATP-binding protein [Roseburia porci]MST74225.1 ATP-binding protein [Roseburia porci]